MENLIYKKESYDIIGLCMEVHNNLGPGFLEIVYKDALEYEFRNSEILFEREKKYDITYKDILLPHKFYADLVVYDKIIVDLKSVSEINDKHLAQMINYLKVSGNKLGLIVNFGEVELHFKRVVYG
jgi:GxxExxY protein